MIAGISSYPMASIQGGWSDIQKNFKNVFARRFVEADLSETKLLQTRVRKITRTFFTHPN